MSLEYSSYLVQRLKKPYIGEVRTPLQAMAKYGLGATGLTPEIREMLCEICQFDYMGSSEYEFGAIPRAIRAMLKQSLIAFVTEVSFQYKAGWKNFDRCGVKQVYVICPKDDKLEIVSRIEKMAMGETRHKERPEVAESLAEYDYSKDVYGWMELDNGYMFFKNQQMWSDFCTLFDLK